LRFPLTRFSGCDGVGRMGTGPAHTVWVCKRCGTTAGAVDPYLLIDVGWEPLPAITAHNELLGFCPRCRKPLRSAASGVRAAAYAAEPSRQRAAQLRDDGAGRTERRSFRGC